jgi:hypothetical protein
MFATDAERQELIEWATAHKHLFKPNGFGRQYGVFNYLGYPKAALDLKDRIVKKFSLGNAEQEPMFKDYCGYITEGGAIHRHMDHNKGKLIHARFNVMVSKPIEGGEPIQNGVVIKVNEGDVWRCDAGLVEHWCSPVVGDKPRIVCSFGFLL